MFTKKPDPDTKLDDNADNKIGNTETKPAESRRSIPTRNPPASHDASGAGPSLIGEDLTVTGNIVSKGEVHVEGEIEGDIHCVSLIVGEKAQITGGIVAEDVIVRGRITGTVRGTRLSLQSSSHVEGDIIHKSLVIEQGAYFEGKSRRDEDPARSGLADDNSSKKSDASFSSNASSTSTQSTRAAE